MTTVTEAVYQHLGDRLAAFGEAGKAYCRDDLHAHLDYLIGSLVAGGSAPFGGYVTWLATPLEARGIPGEYLPLLMDGLEAFFRDRLARSLLHRWLESWRKVGACSAIPLRVSRLWRSPGEPTPCPRQWPSSPIT